MSALGWQAQARRFDSVQTAVTENNHLLLAFCDGGELPEAYVELTGDEARALCEHIERRDMQEGLE